MKTLHDYFRSCANAHRERLFLYDERHSLTYGEALDLTVGLANALTDFGIKASDPVCFRVTRSLEGVLFFFALLGIGALTGLADPHQKAKDFVEESGVPLTPSFYLSDEGGEWRISSDSESKAIDPWKIELGQKGRFQGPKNEEDPLLLCFTSGSTNRSKGVLLSSRALLAHVSLFHDHAGYSLFKKAIAVLPLFHVFGFAQYLALAYYGGSMYFPDSLEEAFLAEKIAEYQIDRFDAVPAFHHRFAKKKSALSLSTPSLKIGIVSGAYLPPERFRELEKEEGIRLIPVYGQSECLTISGYQDEEKAEKRADSIGRFLLGTEGKIVKEDGSIAKPGEVGEIMVRSPQAMNGYLGEEMTPFEQDGFLHTGDLAYQDEEGYLYFAGRIKDMVIKNGINISCPFLERMIGGLPYIEEVAIAPIESNSRGERILCAYTLKEKQSIDEERIKEDLSGLLHKNEVPDRYLLLKSLPRKSNLKVDKLALAKLYQESKKQS